MIETSNTPEIVQVASVFVPQQHVENYLEHFLGSVVPLYQAAAGLWALMVLRRSLVAYEEIITITTWQSIEDMRVFFDSDLVINQIVADVGLIQREPPHTFQVVVDISRSR